MLQVSESGVIQSLKTKWWLDQSQCNKGSAVVGNSIEENFSVDIPHLGELGDHSFGYDLLDGRIKWSACQFMLMYPQMYVYKTIFKVVSLRTYIACSPS